MPKKILEVLSAAPGTDGSAPPFWQMGHSKHQQDILDIERLSALREASFVLRDHPDVVCNWRTTPDARRRQREYADFTAEILVIEKRLNINQPRSIAPSEDSDADWCAGEIKILKNTRPKGRGPNKDDL